MYLLSNLNNGFYGGFLDGIIVLSFLSSVLIIISKNPIVSVLFLILLFSSISCYLIFIGIKFIGLSYLLVYVGAVSILFLFILMLINIRVSELISDSSNSIPLAILAILLFYIPLNSVLPNNMSTIQDKTISDFTSKLFETYIYYVSSNDWDGTIMNASDITGIGNIMYTNYSMWLMLTSIILLLSMVGSIIITIK